MQLLQQTLKKSYSFEGKGLHTGKYTRMTLCPAPENYGIRFVRTDIGDGVEICAVAANVSNTARSTTISTEGVNAVTIEHIMSALTGLGIDNVRVEIDNEEIPILDGSAKPYIDAIVPDGLVEQKAERKYVEIDHEIVLEGNNGSVVKITPADEPLYDIEIDFNSRVLGVQHAHWDENVNYAEQIGVCRTFVFFHEIEFLLQNNLVKGGDVDNAIVIVEHPVTDEQVSRMAHIFNVPVLKVMPSGYLSNLTLRFDNECARHKLLDLIGDIRLCGGFLKAKVTAIKSGHGVNTRAAKAIADAVASSKEN